MQNVTVPEAEKKPKRQSPLRGDKRKAQVDLKTQHDRDENLADKRQLCVDVLLDGYVQAYVDLFYLTHRPDPNPGSFKRAFIFDIV